MESIVILKTNHQIIFKNSQYMEDVISPINLLVTSPPYPMIEMWDELFTTLNPVIGDWLSENESMKAYDLMHEELNKVWSEIDRVLVNGGIVCINIGDATRKLVIVFNYIQTILKLYNISKNWVIKFSHQSSGENSPINQINSWVQECYPQMHMLL